MNRRKFLKQCGLIAGGISLSSTVANAGIKLSNKTMQYQLGRRRPNVIYILADDLGYGDPGCYGQADIQTPSIDNMAAEGMLFTQHYAGDTVCAPSRCALLTGLHTGHCYIRGNAVYTLRPEDFTVGELFQRVGYATAIYGKWGLGYLNTTGHPNNKGFDHFFGYLDHGHAHDYYTGHLYRNSETIYYPGNHNSYGDSYSHDLITSEALDFIQQSKDQPFFLYLAYTIAHSHIECPTQEPYTNKPWSANKKTFAAMVTRMDRDIGRLIGLIKSLGLDEDTLIIFTSDNGPHSEGGHNVNDFDSNGIYRGLKRDMYEGGIRVPMIARWPGKIKPGTVTDHISAFWDFLPTCADLLSIKLSKQKWGDIDETVDNIDGISFLPTLLGKPALQKQHDHLYWEFYERNGRQAIRQGKWKGIRYNVNNYPGTDEFYLFDLDADPDESNNIAATYPAKTQELKDLMATEHTKAFLSNFRFSWD